MLLLSFLRLLRLLYLDRLPQTSLIGIGKLIGISVGSFFWAAISSLTVAHTLKHASERLKNHPLYEVPTVCACHRLFC